MVALRILSYFGLVIVLASCTTVSTVVGGSGRDAGIDVLRLSYDDALDLAFQIGSETFTKVEKTDSGSVVINDYGFWRGATKTEIVPQLVANLDAENETGITYKFQSSGDSAAFALNPEYVSEIFFARLAEKRKAGHVEVARFTRYRILEDRAVAERIRDSIPVNYDGFKRYLDGKKDRTSFEGIWTDPDGFYTLGVVLDTGDPRYRYKAFVIDSRLTNWNPGEIKFKLNDLSAGGIAIGPYHNRHKAAYGVTWSVQSNLLTALNDKKLAFFMIYPEAFGGGTKESEISGVGTGWAVTGDGYFVTNAHVIEGAKKIYIGFREGDPKRARVVSIDARTDLAVLKIVAPDRLYTPLPLAIGKAAPNGTAITVVGYPLAFKLGDDPRVTDGIISAQSGYEKDVTRYQISAPVQPGNSGGPTIGPDGRVAAVVVSGLAGETQNVNFAIKIGYLRTLLDGAGIRYNTAASANMSPVQIFQAYRGSILPVWTER